MSDTIPAIVLPLKRKTWKPSVADGDPPKTTGSKFCGQAYLKLGENYPKCPNCGNPLQLFIQLNLTELPEEAQKDFSTHGIVQLFYCTNENPHCEVECDAWEPFAKSVLARLIESEHIESEHIETDSRATNFVDDAQNTYLPKAITSWEELDDYPNTEELRLLGVDLSDTEREQLWETNYPRGGDKLFGYPDWVQGVEYPNCPLCNERMQLLFQIDSEDNVPFMFGDVGCAHLTQCRTHKDQLAFGWACG